MWVLFVPFRRCVEYFSQHYVRLSQDAMTALLSRVDDIAKEKLASDPKLQYMPEANVTREVLQELDR